MNLDGLWKLAKSWPHKRDRLWRIDDYGNAELLYDSGCLEDCHRCQLEALLWEIHATAACK